MTPDLHPPSEYIGTVVRKPFAKGSKSEHSAIVLVTDQGEWVLRRTGGNPFSDPELEKLVGRKLRCIGRTSGYTLLLSEWRNA